MKNAATRWRYRTFPSSNCRSRRRLRRAKSRQIRVIVNDWSSLIRYGVIFLLFLLTYLLLLRPIKKQALSAFSQLPDLLRRS